MTFTVERMASPLTKTTLKILKTHERVNAPPATFEEFLRRTGAELHKTQKEFLACEARYTAYLAGFGCVAGETQINGVTVQELAERGGSFEVVTLQGLAMAELAFLKGQANLYLVETASGRSVIVTQEHRFLAPSGWRELKDLAVGSHIAADHSRFEGTEVTVSYFWDEIKSIAFERYDNFYDLHVPVHEHYSANGLFHHNSGKSFCLAIKVIKLCYQNQGKIGCLFGPTQSMIRDTIQTHLDEVLERSAIAFEYRASPLPEYKISLPGGTCTILLRGFENWNRIRGGNWAWAAIDEADTAKKEIVTQAMRMIDARLRKKVEGGGVRQTVMASTPEGVGSFLHTFFVRDSQKNPEIAKRQHVIHGSTYENAHNLADGYIDDLLVRYPDDLIKAYLNGEWVNLNQKLVYPEFNRVLNGTKFVIDEDDDLYIGMDFNVGNCSAVTVVCGNGDDKFYALDEFTEIMDTPAMIDTLIRAYPGHHEREKIWIVPDASAKNRDTSNASQSDLILLREAGFSVIEYNQNPRIKDRVAGLSANLKNAKGDRTLFVNGDRCPRSVECLEAQGYDEKTGLPDKTSGFDHVNDSLGYVMAHLNPLGRLREKPATFRLY